MERWAGGTDRFLLASAPVPDDDFAAVADGQQHDGDIVGVYLDDVPCLEDIDGGRVVSYGGVVRTRVGPAVVEATEVEAELLVCSG